MKRPPSGAHVAPDKLQPDKPDKRRAAKYEGIFRLDRLHWLLINTAMPSKEIASQMKITQCTARAYARELFDREGVHGREELYLREIQRLMNENAGLKRALATDPFLQTR